MKHLNLVTDEFIASRDAKVKQEMDHLNEMYNLADKIVDSIFAKYPLHEDRKFLIECIVSSSIESFCLLD